MRIPRKQFNPETPGYVAWQHYPDSRSWAEAASKRLQFWGFTTVGGWSDFQSLQQYSHGNLAYAPVLHIGSTAGAPCWDMWDPKIIERMDQVAREQILALRDHPQVMGYYSDNEIGWWNAALFRMTLEQAPTSGQRQRLMEQRVASLLSQMTLEEKARSLVEPTPFTHRRFLGSGFHP